MKAIAIIHFQPLELYPPITNFLEVIGEKDRFVSFYVFTRRQFKVDDYVPKTDLIRVFRFSDEIVAGGSIRRLIKYCFFYFKTFLGLLRVMPNRVLYYESISFAPVYFYVAFCRLFGKVVQVFCHYHEYNTQEEYNNGMRLNRWLHEKEKLFYKKFDWISQTNSDRLRLFKFDNDLNGEKLFVMPNYPPASWKKIRTRRTSFPIRFVLVGVVDYNSMHIKEFKDWLLSLKGNATWDIYTFTSDTDTIVRLIDGAGDLIKVHKGVSYYDLPALLTLYDIGLVLYNGHMVNYVFNAPNKYFEYYSCGLDVWYSKELISMKSYRTDGSFPKVLEVDFKALDECDISSMINVDGMIQTIDDYTASDSSDMLLRRLCD